MVNKITSPITPLGEIDKINEIIDELDNANVAIDNSTITKNTSDQLQTVAVKDNRSGNAIKTWIGTKEQYDAITTKDSNTLYNITDDTDVTLTLLNALYPVGSIYIGTMQACPLQSLGVGTWQLKSGNAIVTSVDSTAPCKGNGISLGLTNGTNIAGLTRTSANGCLYPNAAAYGNNIGTSVSDIIQITNNSVIGVTTDSTKSGIEATVTSTSLTVNIWERIS